MTDETNSEPVEQADDFEDVEETTENADDTEAGKQPSENANDFEEEPKDAA